MNAKIRASIKRRYRYVCPLRIVIRLEPVTVKVEVLSGDPTFVNRDANWIIRVSVRIVYPIVSFVKDNISAGAQFGIH
jgi:hypothetical protein